MRLHKVTKEPQNAKVTKEPQDGKVTKEPQNAKVTKEPQDGKVTKEPQNAKVTKEPQNAKVTKEPQNAKVTKEPQDGKVTKEPQNAKVTKEPQDGKVTKEPQNAKVTKEPQNAKVTKEPQNAKVTKEPQNAKVTKEPQNAKVTKEPQNGKVTKEPQNAKVTKEPQDGKVTKEPQNAKVTKEPQNAKVTKEPQDGKVTKEPQNAKVTKEPQNAKVTKEPQDGKVTKEPQNAKVTKEPQNAKVTKEPQDGKVTKEPQNAKVTKEPQDGKVTKEPRNGKVTKEPRNGKVTKEPQNGKVTKEPQDGEESMDLNLDLDLEIGDTVAVAYEPDDGWFIGEPRKTPPTHPTPGSSKQPDGSTGAKKTDLELSELSNSFVEGELRGLDYFDPFFGIDGGRMPTPPLSSSRAPMEAEESEGSTSPDTLLANMAQTSPDPAKDTHYVESFNNALLIYHDKRVAFGKEAYLMRINLADLDWLSAVELHGRDRIQTVPGTVQDTLAGVQLRTRQLGTKTESAVQGLDQRVPLTVELLLNLYNIIFLDDYSAASEFQLQYEKKLNQEEKANNVTCPMLPTVAADPSQPARMVYDAVAVQEENVDHVPNFNSVRAQLERCRAALVPPIPYDVEDVVIPDEWA
uniref:Uncharacterized protein n=1 Tax=Branchiostoma floridae TaxID=7739 RepID=C3ZUJ8_BRAFL|eukprot:XP_002587699.1 hypothetical protein BRAFLDRAFT_94602 [Branchiostoma floridae]